MQIYTNLFEMRIARNNRHHKNSYELAIKEIISEDAWTEEYVCDRHST